MLQQTLTFIQTPPLTKIFVGQVSQKERRKPKYHIQKVRHKKMLKIILYFLVVKKKIFIIRVELPHSGNN